MTPESARSKPQMSLRSVVLPLPDAPEPRPASPPRRRDRRPSGRRLPPKDLVRSRDGQAGHRQLPPSKAALPKRLAKSQVKTNDRQRISRRERRRRREGERRRVGPDFGRQRPRARSAKAAASRSTPSTTKTNTIAAPAPRPLAASGKTTRMRDREAVHARASARPPRTAAGFATSAARTLTSASGRNRIA